MRASIRYRLLVILLVSVSCIWVAGITVSFYGTVAEEEEVFDAQLAQSAKVLLALYRTNLEEKRRYLTDSSLADVLGEDYGAQIDYPYENRLLVQVWDLVEKKALLRSTSAPQHLFSSVQSGFSDIEIDGQPLRIFSIVDQNVGIQVQVGSSHATRKKLANEVALTAMIPLLFVIPVLVPLIWFAINKALQPLNFLTNELKRRKPSQLEAVPIYDVPTEIVPMVEALNSLFGRLQSVLKNERRFTADAAHELHTPLTALLTLPKQQTMSPAAPLSWRPPISATAPRDSSRSRRSATCTARRRSSRPSSPRAPWWARMLISSTSRPMRARIWASRCWARARSGPSPTRTRPRMT